MVEFFLKYVATLKADFVPPYSLKEILDITAQAQIYVGK